LLWRALRAAERYYAGREDIAAECRHTRCLMPMPRCAPPCAAASLRDIDIFDTPLLFCAEREEVTPLPFIISPLRFSPAATIAFGNICQMFRLPMLMPMPRHAHVFSPLMLLRHFAFFLPMPCHLMPLRLITFIFYFSLC